MFLQAGPLGIFSDQEEILVPSKKPAGKWVPGLAAFPQKAHQGSESNFLTHNFAFFIKTRSFVCRYFLHHENAVPAQL